MLRLTPIVAGMFHVWSDDTELAGAENKPYTQIRSAKLLFRGVKGVVNSSVLLRDVAHELGRESSIF